MQPHAVVCTNIYLIARAALADVLYLRTLYYKRATARAAPTTRMIFQQLRNTAHWVIDKKKYLCQNFITGYSLIRQNKEYPSKNDSCLFSL